MIVVKLLIRSLLVILVLIVTLWVGETVGPRHARAEVYDNLEAHGDFLIDYLTLPRRPGGQRVLVINGHRMEAEVAVSDRTPKALLDEIEERANKVFARLQTAPKERIGQRIALAFQRPYRINGKGWGVIVRLINGDIQEPGSLLKRIAEGRGFGPEAAGGGVVMAFENGDGSGSTVWRLQFSEGFDPFKLVPDGGQDSAGSDIFGLERFPGSVRGANISEAGKDVDGQVVVYHSNRGSLAEHVAYYIERMNQAHFHLAHQSSGHERQSLLFFEGNGQQATVFIMRPHADRDRITDVVQVRTVKGGAG